MVAKMLQSTLVQIVARADTFAVAEVGARNRVVSHTLVAVPREGKVHMSSVSTTWYFTVITPQLYQCSLERR